MELRSYNVQRVYVDCVKCRIGSDIAVCTGALQVNEDNIKDMCSQIYREGGTTVLCLANKRMDGETWTSYLQIVEMLILLGHKIGVLEFEGKLTELTKITFKDED